MIAIVDYGMGNIASIQNMLKRVDIRDAVLTSDIKQIERADKVILPGVGSFDTGMKNLIASGLISVLNTKALEHKVPVLGICLGMQLLTKKSEEGIEPGLGWIDAETKKFSFSGEEKLKIPHMGWNYVDVKHDSPLLTSGVKRKYYFVHAYYVKCNNESDVLATCNYGNEFTCMVNHENIFGAQFHPEKSHRFGIELFENFAKI